MIPAMNEKPKTKRPRKRWKRVLKWTLGAIFLALILCGFIAYWTSTNDCDRNAATPANPMKAVVYCDYGITNLQASGDRKADAGGRSGPGQGSRGIVKSA